MKARQVIGIKSGEPDDDLIPEGRFPLLIALLVAFVICALILCSSADGVDELSVMAALTIAAAVVGGLIGFLLGTPGIEPTDEGKKLAQARGYEHRIGLIGNALVIVLAGAFALTLANFRAVHSALYDMLQYATGAQGLQPSTSATRELTVLGSMMVIWFVIGLITGFIQMVTNGRSVITSAALRNKRRDERNSAPASAVTVECSPASPVSGDASPAPFTLTLTNASKAPVRLNDQSDDAPGLSVRVDEGTTVAVTSPWSRRLLGPDETAEAVITVTPPATGTWSVIAETHGSFADHQLTISGTVTPSG